MIPLFDLHCDTLGEAYEKGVSLYSSSLQASLSAINSLSPYIQIGAIWSNNRFDSEECYRRYGRILKYSRSQGIKGIVNSKDLKNSGYILAIEDARLINGKLERLDEFKNDGVRIITLTWKDESPIGGAWNTDLGLSKHGKDVLKRCFELSLIPDISHSSYKGFYDAIELAEFHKKPIIASHSNSFSECPHKRNLTDEQFDLLRETGGLVGVSLVPQHLSISDDADISRVLRHIYHFLSLDGEDIICLGCDLDGTDTLPKGINGISDLTKLYSAIENSFGVIAAEKIFFKNAFSFFEKNLI